MSEVHFRLEAHFENEEQSSKAFQVFYGLEKLEGTNLEQFASLFDNRDELGISECKVTDANTLVFAGMTGTHFCELSNPILQSLNALGAVATLLIFRSTGDGYISALTANEGEVVELSGSYDSDGYSESFFEEFKKEMNRKLSLLQRITEAGLL